MLALIVLIRSSTPVEDRADGERMEVVRTMRGMGFCAWRRVVLDQGVRPDRASDEDHHLTTADPTGGWVFFALDRTCRDLGEPSPDQTR